MRTGSRRMFDVTVLPANGATIRRLSRVRHKPGSGWLRTMLSFVARVVGAATTGQACTAGMRSQPRGLFSSDSLASLAFKCSHSAVVTGLSMLPAATLSVALTRRTPLTTIALLLLTGFFTTAATVGFALAVAVSAVPCSLGAAAGPLATVSTTPVAV